MFLYVFVFTLCGVWRVCTVCTIYTLCCVYTACTVSFCMYCVHCVLCTVCTACTLWPVCTVEKETYVFVRLFDCSNYWSGSATQNMKRWRQWDYIERGSKEALFFVCLTDPANITPPSMSTPLSLRRRRTDAIILRCAEESGNCWCLTDSAINIFLMLISKFPRPRCVVFLRSNLSFGVDRSAATRHAEIISIIYQPLVTLHPSLLSSIPPSLLLCLHSSFLAFSLDSAKAAAVTTQNSRTNIEILSFTKILQCTVL